jgi:hypothetical protein
VLKLNEDLLGRTKIYENKVVSAAAADVELNSAAKIMRWHDYLLSIRFMNLNDKTLNDIHQQEKTKKSELSELELKDLWLEDLEELEKELVSYECQDKNDTGDSFKRDGLVPL